MSKWITDEYGQDLRIKLPVQIYQCKILYFIDVVHESECYPLSDLDDLDGKVTFPTT